MSDVFEVLIENIDYELAFDDGLELAFTSDDFEITVTADTEIIFADEVIEILTNSEPGIPAGGQAKQFLQKVSSTPFDVHWVTQPAIHVGSTAPSSPSVGDLWVDTN